MYDITHQYKYWKTWDDNIQPHADRNSYFTIAEESINYSRLFNLTNLKNNRINYLDKQVLLFIENKMKYYNEKKPEILIGFYYYSRLENVMNDFLKFQNDKIILFNQWGYVDYRLDNNGYNSKPIFAEYNGGKLVTVTPNNGYVCSLHENSSSILVHMELFISYYENEGQEKTSYISQYVIISDDIPVFVCIFPYTISLY